MINLSEYKKVHCIGIGGIGLSAVAEVFMSRGFEVSGSDMRESDITEKLMKQAREDANHHDSKSLEMLEKMTEGGRAQIFNLNNFKDYFK